MEATTPLIYLSKQLNDQHDFRKQWNTLSDEDKATLKQWAKEEMEHRGIPLKQ